MGSGRSRTSQRAEKRPERGRKRRKCIQCPRTQAKKASEEEGTVSFLDAAKSGAGPMLATHIGSTDGEVFGVPKTDADTAGWQWVQERKEEEKPR